MVELTPLELLQGIFTLIFMIIAIILGVKISSRYFVLKKREFYLAGITLILLVMPYMSAVVDLIMILLFGIPGSVIVIYIGIMLVAIAIPTWMTLVTDLLFPNKQKMILIIVIVQLIIFEAFIVYAIIVDPTLILIPYGERYHQESPILVCYYLFSLTLFLISGILFVRVSLKSSDKAIHLRGKLILMALVSYMIGAILDFAVEATAFTVTLARIIQISSFTEFYLGFVLPKVIRRLFIKEG